MDSKSNFPVEIKRGSARVKIYYTPSRGRDLHTISYWLDGNRHRQTFSEFPEARREAETRLLRQCAAQIERLRTRAGQ